MSDVQDIYSMFLLLQTSFWKLSLVCVLTFCGWVHVLAGVMTISSTHYRQRLVWIYDDKCLSLPYSSIKNYSRLYAEHVGGWCEFQEYHSNVISLSLLQKFAVKYGPLMVVLSIVALFIYLLVSPSKSRKFSKVSKKRK